MLKVAKPTGMVQEAAAGFAEVAREGAAEAKGMVAEAAVVAKAVMEAVEGAAKAWGGAAMAVAVLLKMVAVAERESAHGDSGVVAMTAVVAALTGAAAAAP